MEDADRNISGSRLFALWSNIFISICFTDLHNNNIIHQEVAASSIELSDHYTYVLFLLNFIFYIYHIYSGLSYLALILPFVSDQKEVRMHPF